MPVTVLLFFLIVVGLPVVGAFIADHHKRKFKLRERELELLGAETAQRAAHYARQVERLEERVRVLERLATDKGLTLSDEIEALRGPEEVRVLGPSAPQETRHG